MSEGFFPLLFLISEGFSTLVGYVSARLLYTNIHVFAFSLSAESLCLYDWSNLRWKISSRSYFLLPSSKILQDTQLLNV